MMNKNKYLFAQQRALVQLVLAVQVAIHAFALVVYAEAQSNEWFFHLQAFIISVCAISGLTLNAIYKHTDYLIRRNANERK